MTGSKWRPSASISTLRQRALQLQRTRAFFQQRNFLEVETPILMGTTLNHPSVASFTVEDGDRKLFLQSSPESALRRLIAADSGPVFEITKAFRRGESGNRHNPEFTLLEWYRPGWSYLDLIDEVDEYLQEVWSHQSGERVEFRTVFREKTGFDPMAPETGAIASLERDLNGPHDEESPISAAMRQCVEPHLGHQRPAFVHDFPAIEASLGKIKGEIAERFEVFIDGMEIANGYSEVESSEELKARLASDIRHREELGVENTPMDLYLLSAVEASTTKKVAGVAIGLDRLMMLSVRAKSIHEVIPFPVDRV